MTKHIRYVSNTNEFYHLIKSYQALNYMLISYHSYKAYLIKRKKHDADFLVFLLTFWSLGIGNLIYRLLPTRIEEKLILQLQIKY